MMGDLRESRPVVDRDDSVKLQQEVKGKELDVAFVKFDIINSRDHVESLPSPVEWQYCGNSLDGLQLLWRLVFKPANSVWNSIERRSQLMVTQVTCRRYS